MSHTKPNTTTVQARAATLLVKPGGQFLTFSDIRLQWRPSKQRVTTAEAYTPIGTTRCLLKRLQSQGTGVAAAFNLNGKPRRRDVEALAKEQRPQEHLLTHVLVRVVSRAKGCRLTRVRVHNGHAATFEEIATPELFLVGAGSLVRVEFSDGRSAELTLDEKPTCRVVPDPLDSEWTVTAVVPESNRLSQSEHAARGRQKALKKPGARRGRHFRRTDPRKKAPAFGRR